MNLENLKEMFLIDENKITKLTKIREQKEKQIYELIKDKNFLELLKKYKSDINNEKNKKNLESNPIYSKIKEIKSQIEIVDKKIFEEKGKLPLDRFAERIKYAQCKHLFYKDSKGINICVKCEYMGIQTIPKTQQDLTEKYLDIELFDLRKKSEPEYKMLTKINNVEEYMYIRQLVKDILKCNPNITNEELNDKIEKRVLETNIAIIEAMEKENTHIDEEIKTQYKIYKKALSKKNIKK